MKINTGFTRGDLDGFFGLFVDNLLQIMLIVLLGPTLCGFTPALLTERILPAYPSKLDAQT